MPLDSIADLERRIRRLEMELDQYKHKFVAPDRTVKTEPPLAHIDHGSLAGLGDDDHPQYRKVADSIDHGALTGLGDNDHPQYLLATGKAADSDKLDGNDSSYFSPTTHNHDHDTLINFVANKHIDHSGVSITAGAGLTGGGNLTATRTIALSHLGFQSLTDPNADRVLFWDDSAGALQWLTVGGIVGTALGQWQEYTPTWTAVTTNPVIGNGSLVGKYTQVGKTVMCNIYFLAGSTTTFGSGDWSFSLPVAAVSPGVPYLGKFVALNIGSAFCSGINFIWPGDTKITEFVRDNTTGRLNSSVPFVWANGDYLFISIIYEVA